MIDRIDFHSHILPGADHGSRNLETSVGQIALQKRAGIGKIVATPHFYPENTSIDSFLKLRASCAAKLKERLKEDDPEVYLGAEVLICPGLNEVSDLTKLCIEGTRTILIEMPFTHFSDKILDTVDNLSRLDLNVVMAHIDRYDIDDVRELMSIPVLAQVNAAQLAHRKTRKQLEPYFIDGRIVAFGTDLHGADEGTVKNYEKGLSKLGEYNEKQIDAETRKLIAGAKPL